MDQTGGRPPCSVRLRVLVSVPTYLKRRQDIRHPDDLGPADSTVLRVPRLGSEPEAETLITFSLDSWLHSLHFLESFKFMKKDE